MEKLNLADIGAPYGGSIGFFTAMRNYWDTAPEVPHEGEGARRNGTVYLVRRGKEARKNRFWLVK
jgi:hypothetical protein